MKAVYVIDINHRYSECFQKCMLIHYIFTHYECIFTHYKWRELMKYKTQQLANKIRKKGSGCRRVLYQLLAKY